MSKPSATFRHLPKLQQNMLSHNPSKIFEFFRGWSNGEPNPGYNVFDYFDPLGAYLGADRDGIEPLFAMMEASKQ